MSNTFGTLFRLTTFGESHGAAVGGIIDGCPSGLDLDYSFIQQEMDRRRPGQSKITSQRQEKDQVEFLSGIFEGKTIPITIGTPIGFIIRNDNQRTEDYEHLKNIFRPSHADYSYYKKYGMWDYRGGGRASARETASRVAGGAIAKLLLKQSGIYIYAYTSHVGEIKMEKSYKDIDLDTTYASAVRCPDKKSAALMEKEILKIRKDGDTIGGIISGVIKNVPTGLGEPVFDKLQANLAKAMLSIPAAKGFDYGLGFEGIAMRGSEANDIFYVKDKKGDLNLGTKTNYSGGIQGGISNGEDIYFRVAFKPVSTVMKKQKTFDIYGNEVEYSGKGRHDTCVLPRAVAVVEAMTALVMADGMLVSEKYRELSGNKHFT